MSNAKNTNRNGVNEQSTHTRTRTHTHVQTHTVHTKRKITLESVCKDENK